MSNLKNRDAAVNWRPQEVINYEEDCDCVIE